MRFCSGGLLVLVSVFSVCFERKGREGGQFWLRLGLLLLEQYQAHEGRGIRVRRDGGRGFLVGLEAESCGTHFHNTHCLLVNQPGIIEMKLAHIVIVSQIMKYVGSLASQHAQLSPATSKRISNGKLFMPIFNKLGLLEPCINLTAH